ncbi:MAG: YggT family protein [Clostridiales bacterium]
MINTLYNLVHAVFSVYYLLILARIFLSWIPLAKGGAITRFIYEMTEPVLGFFRRHFSFGLAMGLDFSPIFAFLALQILEVVCIRLIALL